MSRDVFISHSAQDKKVAETICAALEEAAIRCWVAPRDVRAGRSFPGEITRAIQQSKVMLLIFSSHSNSSEQVLREVQLAVDSHLPIVRLRIEDISLSDDLRYYLSTPQYLDALTTPLSKHIPRLETALRELLDQSSDDAGTSVAATPATLAEVAAKGRPAEAAPKPPAKWKAFAIVAGILAIAVAVVLALRFTRTAEQKNVLAVPERTIAPTPSATISSSPTATTPPSPTQSPIAIVPSPTPPQPPQASPISAPNDKEPAPRNNRAWRVWIDEFVHNFIASGESNDSNLELSFYAPRVDLFEEGWKTTDGLRRDIEGYHARWPNRRNTIRGDVRLTEKAPNRTYAASFEHDFYVENPARGEWINGAAAVELQITVGEDGIPKIVGQKQKSLRKEKGTMQPR